jgi:hypothetical protein
LVATACLLGNGVSVAYNPELSVRALTDDLLRLFRDAGVSDPGRVLSELSRSAEASADNQFERLLGPLSSSADAIRSLRELTPIAEQLGIADISVSAAHVADFLRDVHRFGLAIVLDHIASRSQGHVASFVSATRAVGQALVSLGAPSDLTVATLNYDGLTHAALLEMGQDEYGTTFFAITDLADGRVNQPHSIAGRNMIGYPIRDVDDLPPDHASVLQLHGSLGWLRNPRNGEVWRFALGDLRAAGYWEALRAGRTDWEPVVVLTDQKERAVAGWPFSLAYEAFGDRLSAADRWLIAGYGFGDTPVNGLLQSALLRRRRRHEADPRLLIIDKDSNPAGVQARVRRALRVLGGEPEVSVVGIPEALESELWVDWSST